MRPERRTAACFRTLSSAFSSAANWRVGLFAAVAAQAVVALSLLRRRQLDVLSIVKRRDSLGLLQHSDTEERFTKSSEELHALLQIAMGGMVAEEHWFDEVSTGPASDLAAATSIGAQMIGACGMGTSLISVAAAGNGYLEGSLVDKVLGDKAARAELDTLLTALRNALGAEGGNRLRIGMGAPAT